ncbi:DNA circularization protein [Amantichitinum ursilacus]|uniref:DNA circulation N-terminal domain-containing protein n=1 Tax=Amantichitinum ursilacus TaxID=857265 RepID=A0A0N0XIM6_9NEIS|nr:DNA circularization N-terminal domain-containing protein [Amantichitinum ursilacus]KPC53031.1 hypothetical protein WG78_11090 [Amantichitinum ursilacus]
MGYRDNMQPASFRGVPFKVTDSEMVGGRRLQVNEYPQRDKPYTEDIGRKAREFTLEAFVVGDDYMAQRDRLLAALETPGAGELVHPWLGRMQVCAGEFRYRESAEDGGMCRFSIPLTESGDLTFPSAQSNVATTALAKADAMQSLAENRFAEVISTAGPDAIGTSLLTDLQATWKTWGDAVGLVTGVLDSDLMDAIHDPKLFAQKLFNLATANIPILGSARALYGKVTGLLRAAAMLDRGRGWSASTVGMPLTPVQIARNEGATDALFRGLSVVTASRIAVQAPAGVYDDTDAMRSQLMSALDREQVLMSQADAAASVDQSAVSTRSSDATVDADGNALSDAELAALMPDAAYTVARGLQQAVSVCLRQQMANEARLVTITPVDVLPALVLAYQLYEDPLRGDEIVERNQVPHPGFVPVEPLKVVSQ